MPIITIFIIVFIYITSSFSIGMAFQKTVLLYQIILTKHLNIYNYVNDRTKIPFIF
jgi:hypothetical protein